MSFATIYFFYDFITFISIIIHIYDFIFKFHYNLPLSKINLYNIGKDSFESQIQRWPNRCPNIIYTNNFLTLSRKVETISSPKIMGALRFRHSPYKWSLNVLLFGASLLIVQYLTFQTFASRLISSVCCSVKSLRKSQQFKEFTYSIAAIRNQFY